MEHKICMTTIYLSMINLLASYRHFK